MQTFVATYVTITFVYYAKTLYNLDPNKNLSNVKFKILINDFCHIKAKMKLNNWRFDRGVWLQVTFSSCFWRSSCFPRSSCFVEASALWVAVHNFLLLLPFFFFTWEYKRKCTSSEATCVLSELTCVASPPASSALHVLFPHYNSYQKWTTRHLIKNQPFYQSLPHRRNLLYFSWRQSWQLQWNSLMKQVWRCQSC